MPSSIIVPHARSCYKDSVHLGMTVLLLPALPLTRAPGSPRAEASRQRAWANGLAAWRRRSGLAPAARVFVLTGPFPDARAALAARGFAENPDPASACFDLKWSLRGREARVSARTKQPTHKQAVNKQYQIAVSTICRLLPDTRYTSEQHCVSLAYVGVSGKHDAELLLV